MPSTSFRNRGSCCSGGPGPSSDDVYNVVVREYLIALRSHLESIAESIIHSMRY
jgi:hypothetical protein